MANTNNSGVYFYIFGIQKEKEDRKISKQNYTQNFLNGARDGVRTRDLHIGNVSF